MITAKSFPTPHLAFRGADSAEDRRVRSFAEQQALAAEALRVRLVAELPHGLSGHRDRVDLLRRAHAGLVQWRYQLALDAPRRLGVGLPLDAERFRLSLRDGGPNSDRLGYLGRLRAGATWDATTKTFAGGDPTPASEIMQTYGQAARDRMDCEAPDEDVLLNIIRLIPGRLIAGNRLVRGAVARKIADGLVARVAARGGDTSTMEIGGDPIYVVTADPDDADTLFGIAMILLAGAVDDPEYTERLRAWQQARYLLFQAPRTKKGSDAVTRVFVVAIGAVLFGHPPVLDHDVDLRCMTLGEVEAVTMPADANLHSAAR